MNAQTVTRVALLAEGLRRRMYDFVLERRRPVTRDEAAAAAGISRNLAAFHLDKLAAAGLLKAHYARPTGRGGPGAGRTSKMYEAGDIEVELSLPERHYDIPADILLETLDALEPGEDPRAAAARVAAERGYAVGVRARSEANPAPTDPEGVRTLACKVLRDHGFEPYVDAGAVRLHNCPFHGLARRSPETVCGMNLAFIAGLLRGLGPNRLEAALEPQPPECCVVVRERVLAS